MKGLRMFQRDTPSFCVKKNFLNSCHCLTQGWFVFTSKIIALFVYFLFFKYSLRVIDFEVFLTLPN